MDLVSHLYILSGSTNINCYEQMFYIDRYTYTLYIYVIARLSLDNLSITIYMKQREQKNIENKSRVQ